MIHNKDNLKVYSDNFILTQKFDKYYNYSNSIYHVYEIN